MVKERIFLKLNADNRKQSVVKEKTIPSMTKLQKNEEIICSRVLDLPAIRSIVLMCPWVLLQGLLATEYLFTAFLFTGKEHGIYKNIKKLNDF